MVTSVFFNRKQVSDRWVKEARPPDKLTWLVLAWCWIKLRDDYKKYMRKSFCTPVGPFTGFCFGH